MRRLSHTAKPADGQKKDTSKGAPTAEAKTYATTQEKKNQKQRISHNSERKEAIVDAEESRGSFCHMLYDKVR